jgi:cytochrome b
MTEEPKRAPNRIAVWDLPTRLFHWTLVALIAFSWWSAEEEHFDWHIWSGLAIMSLLIFRLLWGLFGSSTARFVNFVRGPRGIVAYLKDMKGWRPIGHSPLGALSVLAMLAALFVQVGLGLFSVDHDGLVEGPLAFLVGYDAAEEIAELHEDWFDVILILIGLHIVALLFYRLVLGKRLIGPMITGRATLDPDVEPLRRGKWWVALFCLLSAIATTRWIIAGAPPLGG